ncbi:unnamed protein product [Acanthoscelides obtectus]|uniref:RNA-directed DNA polymerase n=1 Tax=Acanthoscelides obtectus TaxID=200917 RepID=A0A9P0Q007_ACAOB|nr:unnamed protein product [Acanthoscelides obtectus]CAK1663161.1 Transposon Ty3-G Gag-Pol polyprotein [Acanthoscelides obtectus]
MSCEWLESVKRGTRSGVLRLERLKSGIRIEIGAIVLVKVEIEYIVEVPARDNVVVSKVYLTMTMEVKGNKTFEVREVYPETSYHFRYLMLCEYRLGNENLKAQIAGCCLLRDWTRCQIKSKGNPENEVEENLPRLQQPVVLPAVLAIVMGINIRDPGVSQGKPGNKVYKLTPYGRRWVVPKKCRWQIVKANHDDIGHFAVDKTLEKIKQRYWFPRMRHFITKYINACLPCLYHKDKGGKRPGYLHSIPKYARPHHTLHIDHLGPFVNTKQGNKYLIVVVDGFSKFVYLKAVPDTSAKYVIQMLTEMFAMLGNPRRLITDLGSAFTSKAFEEFVAARGIRLFTTAVGLPRGNGQCERTNRRVLDALATSGSQTSEDNWDTNLSHIQQGLNSTRHRITQNTPAEVMFGFQLRTDSDKYPDDDIETTLDVTKIRKETAKRLEHNRIEQDLKFNTKRSLPRLYQVGDVVLTKVTSFSANEDSKKLRPKFRGPFKIVEVLPNDRYRVQEDRFTQRSRRPYQAVVDVRDERDVRMAVQSNSMSVAADRQIDGGWGKMTGRQVANALNRFNAAQ